MKKLKKYIALFETCEGCKDIGVVFPDFPGCISAGKNYEEAVKMAHDALSFHVKGMKEDGEKIPEPRTLEQIQKTWSDWEKWKNNYYFIIAYVTLFDEMESYTTLTITLPSYLVNKIDEVSKKRSTFLAEATKSYLGINSPNNKFLYK